MPLQATSGAASQDAFVGNGVAVVPAYIEDVFSTFLYTGNNSTQTITNGIDLSTKGGLVWIKSRSEAGSDHGLTDTVRGATKSLLSNQTYSELTGAADLTSFNTTGFSIGAGTQFSINTNNSTYVSWTFRKQPKFFDIVTYTGNGSSNRQISHSLESAPACMIIKRTDAGGNRWNVYHRAASSTPENGRLALNTTDAYAEYPTIPSFNTLWNLTQPTSTVFTVGSNADVNASGGSYVAYLFAHNAGGFGLTGTDNVISCGSFTRTFGTANSVNIGYEPQWVLIKCTSQTDSWQLYDTMRGLSQTASLKLEPNSSNSESNTAGMRPTATGFDIDATGVGGGTFIYIAIRRGPMKVPTLGTSVFAPVTGSFSSPYTVTTNFPVDLTISGRTAGATMTANDRLRGGTTNSYAYLNTRSTDAELTGTGAGLGFQSNTAVIDTNWQTGGDALWWNFRRAPSFMDEVCYTGNSSTQNVSHNLSAVPELIIVKSRSNASNWYVLNSMTGSTYSRLFLDYPTAIASSSYGSSTALASQPTSTTIPFGSLSNVNFSAYTYVAYLFATCAGVSKVGSYTGTATTKQIDCGFTAGARFVLIKRTDSTGDWYVWDTARGIVAGNDPYILLNDSPQVTTTDYIDTYSAGFEISSTAPAAINANGGSFIFLAIA